jgi:hypothetical protein
MGRDNFVDSPWRHCHPDNKETERSDGLVKIEGRPCSFFSFPLNNPVRGRVSNLPSDLSSGAQEDNAIFSDHPDAPIVDNGYSPEMLFSTAILFCPTGTIKSYNLSVIADRENEV